MYCKRCFGRNVSSRRGSANRHPESTNIRSLGVIGMKIPSVVVLDKIGLLKVPRDIAKKRLESFDFSEADKRRYIEYLEKTEPSEKSSQSISPHEIRIQESQGIFGRIYGSVRDYVSRNFFDYKNG